MLLVWLAACADTGSDGSEEPRLAPEPLRPFAYEETTSGLESLFRDMMRALASGDRDRAEMLAQSLQLDAPRAWFQEVFGDELGNKLYAEYSPLLGQFGQHASLINELRKDGHTKITVERFDKPDDKAAVGYQALALQRMIKPTPLYSVRVSTPDGSKVFHIWSFVYQSGWFRWIGKTRDVAKKPAESEKLGDGAADIREFRVRDADAARKALR